MDSIWKTDVGASLRRARGLWITSLWLVVAVGCGSSGPSHPDGDAAARFDARDGNGEGRDAATDSNGPEATCSNDASAKRAVAQACGCDADCGSGHCVEGICCSTACNEGCKTCAAAGSAGTCTARVAGAQPRDATACKAALASTCGFDGTCDGAGGCRRHVPGTICKAGTCDGDAVTGAFACDGAGRCRPGPTTICAPYSCDTTTGACFDKCSQSSQCVSSQQCVNASCGKKMKGATCAANADCASGFCADGVCCNVSCQGGCVSCATTGRAGTCWPINQGVPDPRAVCKDQGAQSCGTTGTCDGYGGCEKYAAETVCLQASCTGTRRNTPGTCDGSGTCRPQGVRNCAPFLCAGGLCTEGCKTDGDCESGHACVAGLCGKKSLGTACAADSECVSNMCVDGVCCDGACTGGCLSCALSSAMGHCTPIATGAVDPRNVCADQGPTSCATNGRCDGAGGCQKYKEGTLCAPEACAGNVYTPASTCSATGQCTPPDSLPCAPFVCNGNTCFNACTSDQNCVMPNVCNGNSCGKKMRGASCSEPGECQTAFCAQGVCCDTACGDACSSCALPGALGTCTAVPTGAPDPAGMCVDAGSTSCGTNGKCQAGACQRYLPGTSCKDSTCPVQTTAFTPGSSCDGAGACLTPNPSSCFPFQCGGAVCKAACSSDADCAPPAVCSGGSCGLKGLGKTCSDGMECVSGFCAQGVCCNSNCNGTCQSCGMSATLGTCSNVGDGGTDPHGRCADQGQTSCGTDGACDGKGACRVYGAGTACAAASCAAGSSTLTLQRTCDGAGTCKTATTQACAPFLCNGVSACNAACTVDADCLLPNICDSKTNLCGNKRRLGQTCAQTSDCLTGNACVDGVCCGAASCGACQSCAVPGLAGSCANVAAGTPEPHGGCAANPPCGNTGACNGAGACAQAGVGVACGAASCAGSTYTPVSHCTGAGACATPTTSGCSPYVCGGGACLTVCATDGDCVAPFTCQGTGSTRSCALKANGLTCASGGQCISGNCLDGVCCGSASCPACQACNVSGTGACAPVAAGTPTTSCSDQGAPTCGTNGKCDGAGGCQKYADGTTCSTVSCPAGAAALNLAGSCAGGVCSVPTQTCAPYFCNGATACRAACNTDVDCAGTHYCTGAGGTCQPKIAQGVACTADRQCGTTHCLDGVCCGTAACGSCQACNVGASAGTCAPLAAGAADPKGVCVAQAASTCGTTGKCDGAGGCQKHASGTSCAAASCPAGTATLSLAGACSNGACSVTTQPCAPYVCNGAGACRTTCNGDGDCAGTHYCTGAGGTCQPKIAQGVACAADRQCGSTHCVDGVCCGAAACGSCQACNVGVSAGTCAPVGAGAVDPKALCVDNGVGACGTNGRCDGLGSCQRYTDGTTCSAATCPAGGTTLTLMGTCSGGVCAAGTQSCGGYRCNGTTACQSTCNVDGDCAAGSYCTGAAGSCLPRVTPGLACASDHQCGTGHCVDGVCCGTASCASCQACNVGASAGTCAPVGAGTTDPKGVCADRGAGLCGTNGKCDGAGACQTYAAGTACSVPSCPAGTTTLTLAGACGSGTCATTTQSCGAFMCNGAQACRTTCAGDGDCAAGNFCALMPVGTCTAKLALGAACTGGGQCGSGNCVDGACCGTASCGACQACNLTGTGACSAVTAGAADPHGGCAAQAASTCGRTGVCNGAGACQTYADGTSCSAASCPTGATSFTLGGTCSGGSCQAGAQSCNGHLCNGTSACQTTCNTGADCAGGYFCTGPGGTCQAKVTQGGACTDDGQCGTGHCVDYTCCGTATCGQCNACNLAGSLGTCHLVDADTFDPRGACQDAGATSCGPTGKCTAGGACQTYAAGTTCSSPSCPAGSHTLTMAGGCASGACNATTFDCGAYKCDGAQACLLTCAGDTDCTTGNYCSNVGTPFATCTSKLTNGQTCTATNQCATGNCVDGHCCGAATCGGCQSCGVTGHEGGCFPTPAGSSSNGFCADDGAASCQGNGKCDGASGCQVYATGTVCVDAFCAPTTNQLDEARTCDGAGTCTTGASSTCDAYLCKDDATGCRTDCTGGLGCASGFMCDGGTMSCVVL